MYTPCEIQLIEALAWLDTSKNFEFNFVQKFFNHEYTGIVEQSEYFQPEYLTELRRKLNKPKLIPVVVKCCNLYTFALNAKCSNSTHTLNWVLPCVLILEDEWKNQGGE